MSDQETMDRVFPMVTNADALSINEAWCVRVGRLLSVCWTGLVWALRVRGRRHGQPGTLVKSYPAVGLPERMLGQADCSTAPTGWKLQDGQLQAPSDGSDGGAEPLCVGGQEWSLAPYVGCPPTTRHGGVTSCGLVLQNCSQAPKTWLADPANGALALNSSNKGASCLYVVSPPTIVPRPELLLTTRCGACACCRALASL